MISAQATDKITRNESSLKSEYLKTRPRREFDANNDVFRFRIAALLTLLCGIVLLGVGIAERSAALISCGVLFITGSYAFIYVGDFRKKILLRPFQPTPNLEDAIARRTDDLLTKWQNEQNKRRHDQDALMELHLREARAAEEQPGKKTRRRSSNTQRVMDKIRQRNAQQRIHRYNEMNSRSTDSPSLVTEAPAPPLDHEGAGQSQAPAAVGNLFVHGADEISTVTDPRSPFCGGDLETGVS